MPATAISKRKPNDVVQQSDRAKLEVSEWVDAGTILSDYNQLHPTIRNEASMLFMPNGYNAKTQKIYSAYSKRPQRNLLKYTEQFDNAYWGKTNCSAVPETVVDEFGNNRTAFKLLDNATNGQHHIETRVVKPVDIGVNYTASFYVKPIGALTVVVFSVYDGSFGRTSARNFTIGAGVTNMSNSLQSITVLPNGWFKLTATYSFSGTPFSEQVYRIRLTDNTGAQTSYAGTGNDGIYLSKVQLEQGSTATAYEPFVEYADYTFTRASMATMVGSNGLIRNAPHNWILRSEEIDASAWNKNNVTVTANATIAPDGTMTGDLVQNTPNVNSNINQGTGPTGQTITDGFYTKSLFVKPNGANSIIVIEGVGLTTGSGGPLWFDANTNQFSGVGTTTAVKYGYYDAPYGWKRVWVTVEKSATKLIGFSTIYIGAYGSATNQHSVYIWGLQFEQNSSVSPYVYTAGAIAYAPRFEYQYAQAGTKYKGLLVEKGSTNICPYSNSMMDGSWGVSAGTKGISPTEFSPDGTPAIYFQEDTGSSSTHSISKSVTITANTTYAASIFIKRGTGGRNLRFEFVDSTYTNRLRLIVNLTDGSYVSSIVGSSVLSSAGVIPYSNGWYRVWVCGIIDTTSTAATLVLVTQAQNVSLTSPINPVGDGSSQLLYWGGQVEASNYPTSLIFTGSSAASRATELVQTIGISHWFNSAVGTMVASCQRAILGNAAILYELLGVTGSSPDRYNLFAQANQKARIQLVPGGIPVTDSTSSGAGTTNQIKMATAYDSSGNNAASLDGTIISTNTTAFTPPTYDRANIGSSSNGQYGTEARALNGWVKWVAHFPTRRTNAELQQITA